jgi:nucleoside-diphosphate-sugar epimerase
MKVFITGATGYIGGAVGEALAAAGHEVLALAHRTRAADELRGRGWTPIEGDLREPSTLETAAAGADAVIHAANTNEADAAQADGAAVAAFLHALEGSGRPFVYTSGVWVLGDTGGRVVDETASTEGAAPLVAWRAGREREVLAAGERGVRPVVVRPGIVYGRGGGIPAMLVAGDLPLIGEGAQHWTTVHVDDLADLYVRALDAPAGTLLHGISGEATMAEVAAAAEAARGEPVERLSLAAARERLGGFADALALDQRASSRRSRELTGWDPRRPFLLDDLRTGSYL